MARVLLVDDDRNFTKATSELIELLGHRPSVAQSVEEAKGLIDESPFELLMLDLMLPDGSGLQLLDDLEDSRARRVAIITGHPGVKSTIRSLGGPAVSYLTKPIDADELRKLLDSLEQGADGDASHAAGEADRHFGVLIGESKPMQDVYRQIERVAPMDVTVFIQGESGSGKEVVAEAIHRASNRKGPFVPVNCGSFSKDLIGSELFGHEKGSFTGASRRHNGLFERAEKGTLFLDEITEMPVDLQPNLLRVLETGRITRVGGSSEIDVDARLLAATNRDPKKAIRDSCLREDLYFRLAVFPITVPPLRKRKDDIPLLAGAFMESLNERHGMERRLTDDELKRLQQYDWPGNVRELKHAVQRAYIMADPHSGELQFPANLSTPFGEETPSIEVGASISEMEQRLILKTLEHCDDDRERAADMLGITVKTLDGRLKKYGKEG